MLPGSSGRLFILPGLPGFFYVAPDLPGFSIAIQLLYFAFDSVKNVVHRKLIAIPISNL
jgi:hypothetical protein